MKQEQLNKRIFWLIWGMMLIMLHFSDLYAAEKNKKEAAGGDKSVQVSMEYFFPTDEDRNIRTYNFNAYYPIKINDPIIPQLSFQAGLTAIYASGDITQLEEELSEGTLNYESQNYNHNRNE